MSSPQATESSTVDKPPKLERLMRKATKVLRRGSLRRNSLPIVPGSLPQLPVAPAQIAPLPSAPAAGPPQRRYSVPVAVPELTEPLSSSSYVPEIATLLSEAFKENKAPALTATMTAPKSAEGENTAQEQKLRTLFSKYGLTLEPGDWKPTTEAGPERIERKVRMRVHRLCHRCQASFGSEEICNSCQHARCKKCPRFPAKKPSGPHTVPTAPYEFALLVDDPSQLPAATDPSYLKFTSRVTGKELTRKAPVHRVRRVCHKCDTLFVGNAVECAECTHLRCAQCPRDPPKARKYPHGYPGDREETYPLAPRQMRTIRVRVRWTCHECSGIFLDRASSCTQCGHHKCRNCPRDPPAKPKEHFEQATIDRVEEKMRNIVLSPQAPAA